MGTQKVSMKTAIQHVNAENKTKGKVSRVAKGNSEEYQSILNSVLKDKRCNDARYLEEWRGAFDAFGTSKQRKEFEAFERLVYGGKTLTEANNTKLLREHLITIDNAQSLEDLELIKKDFGNMGASEELQKAFKAKQDYFRVENAMKKQELARLQEKMEYDRVKTNLKEYYQARISSKPNSGLNQAELHKKLGIKMPFNGKSGIALNEEISAKSIELGNLKAEKTKLQGSLADLNLELNNVKNRNNVLWGENLKLEKSITELNQEIERINKNSKKISEFGHNSLKTIKNLKRAGIAGLILGVGLTVGAYFMGRSQGKNSVENSNETTVLPKVNTVADKQNEVKEQVIETPKSNTVIEPEAKETLTVDPMANKYITQKGDSPWAIAKNEIENNSSIREATQKKFEEKYGKTPTTDELISFRSKEIRALNGIELESDGYTAIIQPNDTFDVKY